MNIAPVRFYNNFKNTNFTSKKQEQNPTQGKNIVVLYDNAAAEAIKNNAIAGFDSIRLSIQAKGDEIFETYKDNMDFLPLMLAYSVKVIDENHQAFGFDEETNTAGIIAINDKNKMYGTYLENCAILDDNSIEASIAYNINDDKSVDYYDGEIMVKDGAITLLKGEHWKFDRNGRVLESSHLNV